MSNISATAIPTSNNSCESILTYLVTTQYPNNKTIVSEQRLHYTWKEYRYKSDEGKWTYDKKILMIHISTALSNNAKDTLYPFHYKEISTHKIQPNVSGKHITVKGTDHSTYYLLSNAVIWIESQKNSKHSIIHTLNRDIIITESISSLEKKYSEFFLRIHSSYLVNPLYALKIRRFKLTLTDGTELPIPEKKYTLIKCAIENRP